MATIYRRQIHSDEQKLMLARAEAIQSYANLEQALCSVFAAVLQTKPDLAAIVFFKIINTRSRNQMLKKLVKRSCKDKYKAFWNSSTKQVQLLDERRNQIVHWTAYVDVYAAPEKPGFAHLTNVLRQPNYWELGRRDPITVEDMTAFTDQCEFMWRLIATFHDWITGNQWHLDDTWRDIFQRAVVYPPPDNHPLFLQWPKADQSEHQP